MKKIAPFLFLFFMFLFGRAQVYDSSLVKELQQKTINAERDTTLAGYYIDLGMQYSHRELDSLYAVSNRLLKLSEELEYHRGVGVAYHYLGHYYYDNSNYDKALELYQRSYDYREQNVSHKSAVSSAMMIGNVFNTKGDYDKATEQYIICLEVYEEEKDSSSLSMTYSNLGLVYASRKQYEKAEDFYFKSLHLDTLMNNQKQAATVLNNIGGLYQMQEQYDMALNYFQQAMDIYSEIDYKKGLAHGYNNIGIIHYYKGDPETCLDYFVKSLMIREILGNDMDVAQSLNNIGIFHVYEENFDMGIEYSLRSLELAKKSGLQEEIMDANSNLYQAYNGKNDHKNALEYLEAYMTAKDSLYTKESEELIEEMAAKYDAEKKEKALELKDLELREHQAELEAKSAEQKLYFGGIAFLLLMVGLIVYRLVERKKAHELLERQKHEIEEKNTEIMDSINYAKRIQGALLQSETHVSNNFPPHFILFKPKDVVSGDFYWASEKNDSIYIAVADCTGHGVPGAFMSMLGIAFLNEITAQSHAMKPAEILDQLREKIITELSQSEKGGSRDGMDISLIRYDVKSKKLFWSGANNPLYQVRGNELLETKPNKQPIGFYEEMTPFTDHEIEVQKGDELFLFSDGYADQFGGMNGKKLKYKAFKELLIKNCSEEMEMQKLLLSKFIENWRGEMQQIDDICVIGIKI